MANLLQNLLCQIILNQPIEPDRLFGNDLAPANVANTKLLIQRGKNHARSVDSSSDFALCRPNQDGSAPLCLFAP